MRDATPHLQVRSYPFRAGYAAEASAVVAAPRAELWAALLELEAFAEHVPAIERAELRWEDAGTATCLLRGRIGIWRIGVPLEFRYRMRVDAEQGEIELVEYQEGVARDVYFRHRVTVVDAAHTRLESLFYFDLEGFKLLRILKLFERHPWLAEMLNLAAAAMLVRSFQLRWEATS